nr:hypothetical protein [Rhizobium sp. ACO-34A]
MSSDVDRLDIAPSGNSRTNAPAGPRMGPGGAAQAAAGGRARDFSGTIRRLLGFILTHRARLAIILLCILASVVFGVLGPWLLGHATDLVVNAISAGTAIDFTGLAKLLGITAVHQVAAPRNQLAAGMAYQRLRADLEQKPAPVSGGKAPSAAALLVRPAAAWRSAQSRHQRHRQSEPEPAASEPVAHVAVSGYRRAGDDASALAGVDIVRPLQSGHVDDRHPLVGWLFPSALHRAMALNWNYQRGDRGKLYRPYRHLTEIARHFDDGAHGILIMDQHADQQV